MKTSVFVANSLRFVPGTSAVVYAEMGTSKVVRLDGVEDMFSRPMLDGVLKDAKQKLEQSEDEIQKRFISRELIVW